MTDTTGQMKPTTHIMTDATNQMKTIPTLKRKRTTSEILLEKLDQSKRPFALTSESFVTSESDETSFPKTSTATFPAPKKKAKTTSRSTLRQPPQSPASKPDLRCKLCDKVFSYKHCFKTHMDSIHAAERQFKCQICGIAFKRPDHLRKHRFAKHEKVVEGCKDNRIVLKREHKKVSRRCKECSQTFKNKEAYEVHMFLTHDNDNDN